jgi:integrase
MPKYSDIRLTKRTVENAPVPARGETLLWDNEVRGFGVRIYPSGRRVFVLQYETPDTRTTRRLSLGTFPVLTVEAAREMAKARAGDVAKGTDPKRDTVDLKATMNTVFPDYLKERTGKLAASSLKEYERIWTKTLAPAFGTKLVKSLDEAAVSQWHSSQVGTPYAANRAVDLLSAFCTWAEKRGYRPKHSNPCPDVERYPEAKKGRSLTPDEYRRLGATLDEARRVGIRTPPAAQKHATNDDTKKHRPKSADTPKPANPVVIAALRFIALSGWREQEALPLAWASVDLQRGVAVLAETKTKRSERPLGTAALDVLRNVPKVEGHPYVFPGARKGQPLKDVGATWDSVKYAAKLDTDERLRLHDLRHSFTTVARDEHGFHDHIIGRLIGHKNSGGMTSRYGEVRDATVRNAANTVAQTIAGYLDPTPAKVLPFTGKAKPA